MVIQATPLKIQLLPKAQPVKVNLHKITSENKQSVEDKEHEIDAETNSKNIQNFPWTFLF